MDHHMSELICYLNSFVGVEGATHFYKVVCLLFTSSTIILKLSERFPFKYRSLEGQKNWRMSLVLL